MSSRRRPPRLSTKILNWIVYWDGEYGAAGDLEEIYHELCRERSVLRARWYYRMQVAAALPGFIRNLGYWSREMFKNYLKVAWRNIRRHKGYSLIKIAGLAVGLACALFIWLWVQDELSYDRFHAKSSHLFRVEQDQHGGQGTFHVFVTPYPLGPAIEAEIPEVKNVSRETGTGTLLVRHEDKSFFENGVRAVDPAFFDMFTFPLVKGDSSSALGNPNSLVISEDMAVKYFGTDDPLGKTVVINNNHSFFVTGVMKNVPHNSTIRADMLVPLEFMRELGENIEFWGSNEIVTWVEVHDPRSASVVGQKILELIYSRYEQAFQGNAEALARLRSMQLPDFMLFPLTDIRLKGVFGFGQTYGTIQSVKTFGIIALFVLVIACINFMNLSTARAANRAKEVGLRKVVGAFRMNIVSQFYGESGLTTFFAVIIALILVIVLLPAFNTLSGKALELDILLTAPFLLGLLAVVVLTAFISGSYPSLLLASLQPVRVLKGQAAAGARSALFRKVLVIVQFGLSILLLIGTGIVYRQIDFMQKKSLGFDKDRLIYLPLRGETSSSYPALKERLLQEPLVLNVSGTHQGPTRISSNSWGASWEGKDPERRVLIGVTYADFDYPETLEIEMAAGRTFRREMATDNGGAFLVNEEVARLMGLTPQEAVDTPFTFQGIRGPIVGVMKNYHYQSVQNAIEPMAVIVNANQVRFALVRLAGGDIPAALGTVESVWQNTFPLYPFEYRFFDEDYESMYRQFTRMGTILKWFTGMAIFVACLGLFGLASFLAEQRHKEIGVRKVLGASVKGVVILLSQDFAKWVLMANVIAWPTAYFVMKSWLQKFAYRTSIPIWLFVLAGGAALTIALVTVSGQAYRAARTNPAEALKYE